MKQKDVFVYGGFSNQEDSCAGIPGRVKSHQKTHDGHARHFEIVNYGDAMNVGYFAIATYSAAAPIDLSALAEGFFIAALGSGTAATSWKPQATWNSQSSKTESNGIFV